jgi:cellulose synthase/poly-beta-1,6-N-acetylglucosamine synthase-like glycosyltransferase
MRRDSLPIEIAFLADHGVPYGLLQAAARAARCGVTADRALLGEGYVREDDYYRLLAAHLGVPYFGPGLEIDRNLDLHAAIATGIAPLARNAQRFRYLLAPRSAAVAQLLAVGGLPPSVALISPQRLGALIRSRLGRRVAEEAAGALERSDPALTAHSRFSRGQGVLSVCLALSLLTLCIKVPETFLAVGFAAIWATFACSIGLRFAAVAACRPVDAPARIADGDLPFYAIVVALRDETAVVGQLIRALDAIDYPRAKLDIKIVVEEEDSDTLTALARLRLPSRYHVIVAPHGEPRTKPRALNIALASVRSELLVVYDAEDEPAPDQLRLAAARFAKDAELECLQARLVVRNVEESWLTKLFAMEYAALFDVINPGLAALGAPIALGGSSNHFRTQTLRRIGAWDAWNVTEDADLGLRLARNRCRVAALDSDTYEEAPSTLRKWFNQRRRWLKGWVQTQLVHSRQPRRLVREFGPMHALAAQILIGGGVLSSLFGPLFAIDMLWRVVTCDLFVADSPLKAIDNVMAGLLAFAGLQAVLLPVFIALDARGLQPLYRYIPLLPVYYGLISLAAWVALVDFIRRPFHWSKTQHGLALSATYAANLSRDWNILR